MSRWLSALFVCAVAATLAAQQPSSATLHVRETGGIRRTQFPVSAAVPLARGALVDAANVKLLLNQTEVPVQAAAASRWPDGSVQSLAVDFNATIGPLASQDYLLQYGPEVKSDAVARGLTVADEAAVVHVGNIQFSRSSVPLIASVKYRDEAIAPGINGLVVTDSNGVPHNLSSGDDVKVEIVKRGPLVAALRYTGSIKLDSTVGAPVLVPFVITVEMPNSKSWVKVSASVADAGRRVRAVALGLPLALGPFPWVWDFGTTRWTYGSFRAATDSVALNQTAPGAWTVMAGPKGREQLIETSGADRSTFAGWGHVQGAKEVVAFAIEGMQTRPGEYRVAIDASGQTIFQYTATSPASRHELTVYAHFVSTPVQIGAATSPAAILSPLVVTVQ